jgi:hypothetical protein
VPPAADAELETLSQPVVPEKDLVDEEERDFERERSKKKYKGKKRKKAGVESQEMSESGMSSPSFLSLKLGHLYLNELGFVSAFVFVHFLSNCCSFM